ncbi:MAG: holo-ACP synthase [Thermodesulfovibrionales bacterium]|nr:holo-ACP synthase [Thermodesulfovibrionales bacterium]
MIKGTGIDIVKIDRIKKAVEKWGEKFLSRIFTQNELIYCFQKNPPYESLAVRFAAKEAFLKAINKRLSFSSIEIKNEPSGKPYISVKDNLPENLRFHISLSHDTQYAVAVVIVEEIS